jgi:hypothetical protein
MAAGHREAAPQASLTAASTVAGWRQVGVARPRNQSFQPVNHQSGHAHTTYRRFFNGTNKTPAKPPVSPRRGNYDRALTVEAG